MWVAFVVILVPLGFVLFTVIAKGASAHQLAVPDQRHHPAEHHAASASAAWAPAVVGTLEITGFAALMAIPLGVLGAVYINEYGGNGLLAQAHLVHGRRDDRRAVDRDGPVHLHDLGAALRVLGPGGLARPRLPDAADRDPLHLRDAPAGAEQPAARRSYALGATKARVTLTVVLPAAIGGIVSGALLAVARAAGETAPLLFTILTVESTNTNLFSGPNTALSTQIFANATSAVRRRARPGPGARRLR